MLFRSSPRRSSASRLAPVLWVSWACALLLAPSRVSAAEAPAKPAEPTTWQSALPTLIQGLQDSDKLLTQLETIWPELSQKADEIGQQLSEARTQLDALKLELTTWQQSSDTWESSSSALGRILTQVQTSLAESMRRYDSLSLSWSAYKQTAQAQIAGLERSRKAWRITAVAGIIGALAAGFLVGALAK